MVMAFRHYPSSPRDERGMRTTARFVNAEFAKKGINVKLARDFIRDVLKVNCSREAATLIPTGAPPVLRPTQPSRGPRRLVAIPRRFLAGFN